MGQLADRRANTAIRIEEFRNLLLKSKVLIEGKACVYLTGSFGRFEASTYSDLDLFIGGKNEEEPSNPARENLLKRLDQVCVKADLIEASRSLNFPEFSGDGRYLMCYSINDLTDTLGTENDDVANTFTARLLLLLESRPLLGPVVYQEVIGKVIDKYWRDYEDRKSEFMPAFLANDILRLWRTFCVNYEARTERIPAEEKAAGKFKNYKLKHSRLLTCYSALLFLLAVYGRQHTVSPSDAITMASLTPTERLEWLLKQPELSHAHDGISKLIGRYEHFLETTNISEKEMVTKFMDRNISHSYMGAAYQFGDLVYEVLTSIGCSDELKYGLGNRFHRLLVV